MAQQQDAAVRSYLMSLKDPSALKDDDKLAELSRKLEDSDDELERLQLRQQVIDAERPPLDKLEDEFVTHAKAWADAHGISDKAFLAEGVPPQVLRKAGFRGVAARSRGARAPARVATPRSRVSAETVRASIPQGTFSIRQVQEASGASPAVVRRVVQEQVEAGHAVEQGPDPDHRGPGRAPTLYRRD